MNARIVSDSSCDRKTLEGADFVTVPLKIYTEEKEYVDDRELNISQMVEALKQYQGTSHTSCPNAAEWEEAFGDAEQVFAFTISSGLSGSCGSAMVAKNSCESAEPKRKIHVVDSRSAGPGVLILVEKLQELLQGEMSFEEVRDAITEYQAHTHLLFALESLHNLAQNGRVSKVTAKAAGMLGIRAIGTASEDGKLEMVTKCRGAGKTISTLMEEMKARNYQGGKALIGHCGNEAAAEQLKEAVLKEFSGAAVQVYPLGGLCSYYAESGGIVTAFEG